MVITPKRPKANSIHTAAWHAFTRTSPLNFVLPAVFSLIHFPASFIRLWPSSHSDLGGSRHGWGLFLEQTECLQCTPLNRRGVAHSKMRAGIIKPLTLNLDKASEEYFRRLVFSQKVKLYRIVIRNPEPLRVLFGLMLPLLLSLQI